MMTSSNEGRVPMDVDVNTPNKNHDATATSSECSSLTTTPLPPPLSRFEDSPVFNYINNLSPIELVKSTRGDRIFDSPSFSTPPPVFSSPSVNFEKDAKYFFRRFQLSDPSKAGFSRSESDDIPSAAKVSVKEDSAEQQNDKSEISAEPPKESANFSSPDVGVVHLETEKGLRRICWMKNEDIERCDWVTLISGVTELLDFDSPFVEECTEELNMVDPGAITFVSTVLENPKDNTSELDDEEAITCIGCSKQSDLGELGDQLKECVEQKEPNEGPASSEMRKLAISDKAEVKGKKCSLSSCKNNRLRRRCLVFETKGAHKKKLAYEPSNNSLVASLNCEGSSLERHSSAVESDEDTTLSLSSGMDAALHLNGIVGTSGNSHAIDNDTQDSGKHRTNFVSCTSNDKVVENDLQTAMVVCEDSSFSSPKINSCQNFLLESSCKRCNCKRSKCLKLYCECFAAGLYCIEPCMCRDCFNNPAHVDTVLETRKLIESRNPLAFAPKVIRSADNGPEYGEDANKTPASARHKTGCNCKKSSCLKKYCECFQGGVGCTSNCRCESCKNTFGRKNGVEEIKGKSHEIAEDHMPVTIQHDTTTEEGQVHSDLSIPSEAARSAIQPLFAFHKKLPRSSLPTISRIQICTSKKLRRDFLRKPKPQDWSILDNDTSEVPANNYYSISSGVQSTSPNWKRVSADNSTGPSSTTWRHRRKLVLRSIPPFPSLKSPSE